MPNRSIVVFKKMDFNLRKDWIFERIFLDNEKFIVQILNILKWTSNIFLFQN